MHPVGASSLLDYLARELHRYRQAVSRMGQDIVALNEEVKYVDSENAALRQRVGMGERGRHDIEQLKNEMSLQYGKKTYYPCYYILIVYSFVSLH